MAIVPPIPDDPALLRQPTGVRFADIPVPFLLLSKYPSDPDTVMTWLVRAMAEREDAALGMPPREEYFLAATAGIDLEDFGYCTDGLIADHWLTRDPNGTIRVPWGHIYETSVEAAWQLQQHVTALRARHAANQAAASPSQQPLDLE